MRSERSIGVGDTSNIDDANDNGRERILSEDKSVASKTGGQRSKISEQDGAEAGLFSEKLV